jgi:tRNA/rRNA methyltransferase
VAPVAPFADQDRMFSHLRKALVEMHFLYGPSADSLMHGLRHLIARARPSSMEVDLLFGLARQLLWYAAHYPPHMDTSPAAEQGDNHGFPARGAETS